MKYKIPYGITDFIAIRKDNYYFVDKTPFIPALEDSGRYLLYLRPRRFGKTFLLSMLECYYSREFANRFEELFKGTWIYNNKTDLQGQYYVLIFDFSMVSIENVEKYFRHHIKSRINIFLHRYSELNIKDDEDPKVAFENILEYFTKNPDKKLMILVDEYDHFANRLLLNSQDDYKKVVKEKTAFYREFFAMLKGGASGSNAPIERLLITGVTPMTLFDVTSGFNIADNISLDPKFNTLTGFTQQEVEKIFKDFEVQLNDELRQILSEWYDDYMFSKNAKEKVYNSDMIWYFLKRYLSYGDYDFNMIDPNVKTNYMQLLELVVGEDGINGNFKALMDLLGGKYIEADNIVDQFSAFELKKEENFKSLLFYLGLTTIKDALLKLQLGIPNETVKRIDSEFLTAIIEYANLMKISTSKISDLYAEFALKGTLDVFTYIAYQIQKAAADLHAFIEGEVQIKALYAAYLSLFQLYIVKIEQEANKGFADLAILPFNPKVKYFGLVEFKYVKREEKLTKSKLEKLKQQAITQLNQYAQDTEIQHWVQKGYKLKKIYMIWHGWEMVEIGAIE